MRSLNGNYLLVEEVEVITFVKKETEVSLLEYIGNTIRKARTAKNFTQTQLSFMTGDLVSNATISQIETAVTNPSVNILDAIAQALDLEVSDLLPPKNG